MLVRTFGSEVWMLTVLEVSFAIGMVIGGALMALFAAKADRLGMIIGSSILFGLLAIGMGFTTNLIIFFALFFVVGIAVPAFSTSAMTLLQETVEPERQGPSIWIRWNCYGSCHAAWHGGAWSTGRCCFGGTALDYHRSRNCSHCNRCHLAAGRKTGNGCRACFYWSARLGLHPGLARNF
jgi:MFS family permease